MSMQVAIAILTIMASFKWGKGKAGGNIMQVCFLLLQAVCFMSTL